MKINKLWIGLQNCFLLIVWERLIEKLKGKREINN
jgi:hypothetical protein